MTAIKYSKQREAIAEFLMSRKDHPTAEVIYQNVREKYPNISLGTVYRNLALLEELGDIQKIPCGDASEHFDGNVTPHPHFVCTSCHKVLDLEMDNLDFLNTLANKDFEGKIESHQLCFYGKCKSCL